MLRVYPISSDAQGTASMFRIVFTTKNTLYWTLMIAALLRDDQQMKQYEWNIPCDFGRSYIAKQADV
jgi:hypothetical protein